VAWSKYAVLEALLSPLPRFQKSFCLAVKTCGPSECDATLKAAGWFFWEAMKQWHHGGKLSGAMLLRHLELPKSNVMASHLYPNKLQSLLEEMHSIPGLPANQEEMLAITNKLRRMITCSKPSTLDQISLKQASVSAWLANVE
jgi:hypothetical protein